MHIFSLIGYFFSIMQNSFKSHYKLTFVAWNFFDVIFWGKQSPGNHYKTCTTVLRYHKHSTDPKIEVKSQTTKKSGQGWPLLLEALEEREIIHKEGGGKHFLHKWQNFSDSNNISSLSASLWHLIFWNRPRVIFSSFFLSLYTVYFKTMKKGQFFQPQISSFSL